MDTKARLSFTLRGLLAAFSAATLLLAAWWLPAAPPTEPPSGPLPSDSPGAPSVLLLRNGQVLQGRITPAGSQYVVAVPGGEIRVGADEVQCHCRAIGEVYQRRRGVMRLDSAQDHLEMAQWCLRVGLLDAARLEVSEAVALDATHPLIPLVERRIHMAANPQEKKTPLPPPTPTGPSAEELDRMVRGLPPKAVETFVRSIQPILMNNCTTGGCHAQGTKTAFPLLRVPAGGPPSPRLTQRNLYAALQWIDWQEPGASPLLKAPSKPHGTTKSAVFADRQLPQYRQLVDWCYRVAQVPSPVVQASYEEPVAEEAAPRRAPGASVQRSSRLPRKPAERVGPQTSKPGGGNLSPGRAGTTPGPPPADPFDPEVFNRRFAPPVQERKPASDADELFGPDPNDPPLPPGSAQPVPGEVRP